MKVAVPVSSGRVSTVFDFARRLLVVEFRDGRETDRFEIGLRDEVPLSRAHRLQGLGVRCLICGAISRSLVQRFEGAGVEVTPLVSGSVDEVLAAYLSGELEQTRFLMPGCTANQRTGLQESRRQSGILRGGGQR